VRVPRSSSRRRGQPEARRTAVVEVAPAAPSAPAPAAPAPVAPALRIPVPGVPRYGSAPEAGEAALQALWTAWFSIDPRAAVADASDAAVDVLRRDQGDEAAWYALLRGREMLGDPGPVLAGPERHDSLLEAADAVSRRLDWSARLAAVHARLDGGTAAARSALLVNPSYAAAQVALGRALLREGQPQAARVLLEEVREPERVQGGAAALARARLETGEPGKALIAAARETNAPGLCGLEPAIHDPALVNELDEIRGLARLALGATDAGVRSLLRAAAAGSAGARKALTGQAQRDDVRRALGRLARDSGLAAEARALAAALAG
jgi:hypothetical protein